MMHERKRCAATIGNAPYPGSFKSKALGQSGAVGQ